MSGVFVTGTDTDCGKTEVSLGLMAAWQARGERVLGMKPVATGCDPSPEGPRNADARRLQAQGSSVVPYGLVNPYAFVPPIAPHIAAGQAGVEILIAEIVGAYRALAAESDLVVVEGVGGWRVPLSASLFVSDIPKALGLPVILVVGLKLGCLNHALLDRRQHPRPGLHPGRLGRQRDRRADGRRRRQPRHPRRPDRRPLPRRHPLAGATGGRGPRRLSTPRIDDAAAAGQHQQSRIDLSQGMARPLLPGCPRFPTTQDPRLMTSAITDAFTEDHHRCDQLLAEAERRAGAGSKDWSTAASAAHDLSTALDRHFRLEEESLFPALAQVFKVAEQPIEVMVTEHAQMRALLADLAEAVAARDQAAYLGILETLHFLIQQHNYKEEGVLYPMADGALPLRAAEFAAQMGSH